jgi:accessory gene regulator B
MLNRIVKNIVQFFYENKIIEKDDIEIYEYGLQLLLSSLFEILAVIVVSIFIGKLFLTILFLIPFCVLRTYAGGYHANSHFKCFLTLIFVYIAFLLMIYLVNENIINYIALIFSVISELLVLRLAPVESENKPLSMEEKHKYRKISIFVISVETLVVLLLFWIEPFKYYVFAISFAQIAAALSLVVVRIINFIRRNKNEMVKNCNG